MNISTHSGSTWTSRDAVNRKANGQANNYVNPGAVVVAPRMGMM